MSVAIGLLEDTNKLEGSHDFLSWSTAVKTAIQFMGRDTTDITSWDQGTRATAANPLTKAKPNYRLRQSSSAAWRATLVNTLPKSHSIPDDTEA